MQKYWQIFLISLQSVSVYQASFWLRQIRHTLRILTYVFFWQAIFAQSDTLFGYQTDQMLRYILGVMLLGSFILTSVSLQISTEISSGALSNYLLKPVSYFGYWFIRDVADKLFNLLITGFIIVGLVIWLKVPLTHGTISLLLQMIMLVGLASGLYFLINTLVMTTTFWQTEHQGWPQIFLFLTILELGTGLIFPLDMLPDGLYAIVIWLPTSYLIYMPMQIWLGNPNISWINTSLVTLAWIVIFAMLLFFSWQRGLKRYEAAGR